MFSSRHALSGAPCLPRCLLPSVSSSSFSPCFGFWHLGSDRVFGDHGRIHIDADFAIQQSRSFRRLAAPPRRACTSLSEISGHLKRRPQAEAPIRHVADGLSAIRTLSRFSSFVRIGGDSPGTSRSAMSRSLWIRETLLDLLPFQRFCILGDTNENEIIKDSSSRGGFAPCPYGCACGRGCAT